MQNEEEIQQIVCMCMCARSLVRALAFKRSHTTVFTFRFVNCSMESDWSSLVRSKCNCEMFLFGVASLNSSQFTWNIYFVVSFFHFYFVSFVCFVEFPISFYLRLFFLSLFASISFQFSIQYLSVASSSLIVNLPLFYCIHFCVSTKKIDVKICICDDFSHGNSPLIQLYIFTRSRLKSKVTSSVLSWIYLVTGLFLCTLRLFLIRFVLFFWCWKRQRSHTNTLY